MKLTELFLVTIITERIFRDDIINDVKELGATGYTLTDTTGEGSRGVRASDWEGKNVKIEVVVNKEVGDKIIDIVAEKYFENYSVIAYAYPVKVVRGDKYI
jgi:nitrogen regulatory protein P-II 2